MFAYGVRALLAVVAVGAAIGMSVTLGGQTGASSSQSETEWRFFGGDAGLDFRRHTQLHARRARREDRTAGTRLRQRRFLDLAANLRWDERPGLPREGRVANTSPVAIVGNVLVAPISMHTGSTPNLPGASVNEPCPMNIPGDVVGYDTRTGKMLWRFNTIPRPGEEGAETWLEADPKVWEVPGGLNA